MSIIFSTYRLWASSKTMVITFSILPPSPDAFADAPLNARGAQGYVANTTFQKGHWSPRPASLWYAPPHLGRSGLAHQR